MATINIPILQPNKTNFISPILSEENIMRTGTIKDDSSFLHSVLYACSSEYRMADDADKIHLVEELRLDILKLDKNKWISMDIDIAFFQENLMQIIKDTYRFVNKKNVVLSESPAKKIIFKLLFVPEDENSNQQRDSRRTELFKLLFELVPFETFEQNIIPDSRFKCTTLTTEAYTETIMTEITKKLSSNRIFSKLLDKKKNFILNTFNTFITLAIEEINDKAYNRYNSDTQNIKLEINS